MKSMLNKVYALTTKIFPFVLAVPVIVADLYAAVCSMQDRSELGSRLEYLYFVSISSFPSTT